MNVEIVVIFVVYGVVMVAFGVAMGYLVSQIKFYRDIGEVLRRERKIALKLSRAVIKGKVSEQMFPITPFFSYNLSDARFIGSPVDYIVFDGYSDGSGKNIKEIVFVEVKTGSSRLSDSELAVKEAVDSGRVRFEVVYVQGRMDGEY